ncbi:MAG TPA: 23S rRNA (uracil(1939)-C(5))-methyltransferase RlmD [Flavilitoribacter sp.]|nr:23S rRNA (uracil(1939)-C(5))-methyltransferase RlmD [Flavilitoribacter sp.]
MGRNRREFKVATNVVFTGIADKGKCVGKTQDGQVVFAEGAAPGDVADVLVRPKKGFLEGRIQQIHTYAPDRTEPFCRHFEICGGCRWQHITYDAQLKHKQSVVENALTRIGKVAVEEFLPIVPAEKSTYYRNKLEFTFSDRRYLSDAEMQQGLSKDEPALGFYRPGTFDRVINIDHCWLQDEPTNALRNAIREIGLQQGLSFYDHKNQQGFLRQIVIRVTTLGQTMLIVSFGQKDPKRIAAFLDEVLARFPQITTTGYCISAKLNNSIQDLDILTYQGKGYIEEQLGHVSFRISFKSFFQTNTRQAVRLYSVAASFAGLTGTENVYDLYTGLGSIALFLAANCRQVVGIEEVAPAIEDARENARLNSIENAVFYAGDVKDILTEDFARQHGKPDVLITDPPRAGMDARVVEMLLKLAPPRIVYVSCNPATQARDLNLLSEQYQVLRVQPVDMFPHTSHIESVALLELI